MQKTFAMIKATDNLPINFFTGMIGEVLDIEDFTEKTFSHTMLCGFLLYVLKTQDEIDVFKAACAAGNMVDLNALKGALGDDIIVRLKNPEVAVMPFEPEHEALLKNSIIEVI